MIILINGIGCTGKTLMAQKLLEKYKIPYLSADHLKMGLFRGMDDCGYTPTDTDEVIAEKLWPILKGIIMTNIENNQNLIIEGCYILPKHLMELDDNYSRFIISVFLGFSNRYVHDNFETGIIAQRNVIESRKYPEGRNQDEYIHELEQMRSACLHYDVDYFEIDRDYELEITKVYEFIEKRKLRSGLTDEISFVQ